MQQRQLEGQLNDMRFVSEQAQNKSRELEAECAALRRQMEQGLTGESLARDSSAKRVQFADASGGFELSHKLAGDNSDPNAPCSCGRTQFGAYSSQQNAW